MIGQPGQPTPLRRRAATAILPFAKPPPPPRRRRLTDKPASQPVDCSRGVRPTRAAERRQPTPPCRAEEAAANLDRLHWFALRVAPGREFAAVDALAMRGVFAFAPTATVYRRANRTTRNGRLRVYPSAPGYVIVGLDPGDERRPFLRWAAVFATREVLGVVSNDDTPTRLRRRHACAAHPVAVVLDRLVTVSPEAQRFMRAGEEFAVGDVARVCEGAFSGFEGEVTALDLDAEAARVVMLILGAAREVSVPIAALAKAG